jgi:hypothetical protein
MALTATEKKILGFMTDSGQLVGQMRENVAIDDEYARQVILEFKQRTIPAVQDNIANCNALLAIETDKLACLQE